MDNLLKEIHRVQRRLALERFVGILAWCWFAALILAALAIGAGRIWPLADITHIRDWHWLAGFLGAGLAVAAAWTYLTVAPAIQAALEIDRRCGLKERVSSTLAMTAADRESDVGQALIADADNRLKRAAVMERFPVRPPRHLWLPLAPAALVLATMVFWAPAVKAVAVVDPQQEQPPVAEIKKSVDDLRQKLEEHRKELEKHGDLKDANDIFTKLEEGVKEMTPGNREKNLVKINDLARELQERRKQLGGGSDEALKKQLEQVEKVGDGPGDKLAKALAKGDFEKAAQQLEQLQKQIANNKLDQAKKDELAKQLDQLKQKMNELAKQQKEAQADMQKQAQQMKADNPKQSGDNAAASKLEEQIQQMQQQGPRMDALNNLCNKLGQCANQMKQGNGNQAAQQMQQALQQMQQMAKQQQELKTLDQAAQTLADARRQMACDKCGGKGCKECQGGDANQMAQGQGGQGDKDNNGKPGIGMGPGRGDGARPEANSGDGRFYDSRVAQKVGKGAGQITGMTDGANLKNQAEAEIQQTTTAVEHGSTDPLSGQRLPKRQSENARQYFDSFREGK